MHQHYQNKLTIQEEQKSIENLTEDNKLQKNTLMVPFFGTNS